MLAHREKNYCLVQTDTVNLVHSGKFISQRGNFSNIQELELQKDLREDNSEKTCYSRSRLENKSLGKRPKDRVIETHMPRKRCAVELYIMEMELCL